MAGSSEHSPAAAVTRTEPRGIARVGRDLRGAGTAPSQSAAFVAIARCAITCEDRTNSFLGVVTPVKRGDNLSEKFWGAVSRASVELARDSKADSLLPARHVSSCAAMSAHRSGIKQKSPGAWKVGKRRPQRAPLDVSPVDHTFFHFQGQFFALERRNLVCLGVM
jgi:hypothetical protein